MIEYLFTYLKGKNKISKLTLLSRGDVETSSYKTRNKGTLMLPFLDSATVTESVIFAAYLMNSPVLSSWLSLYSYPIGFIVTVEAHDSYNLTIKFHSQSQSHCQSHSHSYSHSCRHSHSQSRGNTS